VSPTPLADPTPPEIPSQQDLEEAEDILFTHPPRAVARLICACGADYPCEEVRFAHLIREAL
jgi:hypothetical protein